VTEAPGTGLVVSGPVLSGLEAGFRVEPLGADGEGRARVTGRR
jgi:hypothetical protein